MALYQVSYSYIRRINQLVRLGAALRIGITQALLLTEITPIKYDPAAQRDY